jgi:hypothetical protein
VPELAAGDRGRTLRADVVARAADRDHVELAVLGLGGAVDRTGVARVHDAVVAAGQHDQLRAVRDRPGGRDRRPDAPERPPGVDAQHRARGREPDAPRHRGVVRRERAAGGVAGDDQRRRVDVGVLERGAQPDERVAQDLRGRLGERVLVARVDHGVARAGEMLKPRAVEARLRRAPAVQEEHDGERLLRVLGADHRHVARALAARRVDEVAAPLLVEAVAAAAGEGDREQQCHHLGSRHVPAPIARAAVAAPRTTSGRPPPG